MEFGVFDHLDRYPGSLADYYEDRLKITQAYDRSGFYAYHLAEHHATPLGMAPSPSVFLAAVAQRTRRLRFGPLVYTLSLHHPLRVVEEICMLDQMSGGRLEVGVGRGISPHEVAYYGVDPANAQRAHKRWHQSFFQLWEKHGTRPMNAFYPDNFDEAQQLGFGIAGAAATVRDTLLRQLAEAQTNYLVCRFAFGDMTLEESL